MLKNAIGNAIIEHVTVGEATKIAQLIQVINHELIQVINQMDRPCAVVIPFYPMLFAKHALGCRTTYGPRVGKSSLEPGGKAGREQKPIPRPTAFAASKEKPSSDKWKTLYVRVEL